MSHKITDFNARSQEQIRRQLVEKPSPTPLARDLPRPDAVDKESIIHNAIIAYCKHRGWIYWHGSMAHKARRTVGEPDFVLLADKGRVFFIECKTKTGKLTPEQNGMILAAKILGHEIKVVRSVNEFLEAIK